MKSYGFVHDITAIYYKFNGLDWFYSEPNYSDSMAEKYGYKFDGQFFYRKDLT